MRAFSSFSDERVYVCCVVRCWSSCDCVSRIPIFLVLVLAYFLIWKVFVQQGADQLCPPIDLHVNGLKSYSSLFAMDSRSATGTGTLRYSLRSQSGHIKPPSPHRAQKLRLPLCASRAGRSAPAPPSRTRPWGGAHTHLSYGRAVRTTPVCGRGDNDRRLRRVPVGRVACGCPPRRRRDKRVGSRRSALARLCVTGRAPARRASRTAALRREDLSSASSGAKAWSGAASWLDS